jgi:hypothetical protein
MYCITNGFVYCTSESLKRKEVSLGSEEEGKGSEAETHMTVVCTTSSLASAAMVALIFRSQEWKIRVFDHAGDLAARGHLILSGTVT